MTTPNEIDNISNSLSNLYKAIDKKTSLGGNWGSFFFSHLMVIGSYIGELANDAASGAIYTKPSILVKEATEKNNEAAEKIEVAHTYEELLDAADRLLKAERINNKVLN